MTRSPEQKLKRTALTLLEGVDPITTEQVSEAVDKALHLFPDARSAREQLIREVEAACNVYVASPTVLEGNDDHAEWLPDRRGAIEWRLWHRYQRYLEDEKEWAPQATYRLDDVTDKILRRLEDPQRLGRWDRRGMVVGHVQSGKTANYTGLICKAADAGYKLIIVLAGVHDSLRSQTQLRLDEGFLGYDTQKRMLFDQTNTRLGVGQLPGVDFYHVNSLTSSAPKGDFQKKIANTANITVGGADPLLLVVKKNKSILNNLISWVTSAQQEVTPGDHKLRVPRVPMLVIDDECDHASVNTKDTSDSVGNFDPDVDPTAINGCIRRLLDAFEQTAYIGYTATPFANIFIFKDARTDKFGEDLFPRSFIVNLRKASDYIGAARVFGLEGDDEAGVSAVDPLPITRTVEDADAWLPSNHKSHYTLPDHMPASLRKALLSFVLVCAIRRARGQENAHNSMLLHVTRFTNVQAQVAERIGTVLAYIQDRLEFGDGAKTDTITDELHSLWRQDFLPTSGSFDDDTLIPVAWDQVKRVLRQAAAKIEVRIINGTAADALEYFDKPSGISVVAVGGDKLSRGLTLEGLSVSYYLRTSRMYDTLLQMGRWFGYRPGYADLCRLFTTAQLQRWYKNIALANEELLLQFDEMALTGGTPEDFGLRVRRSPDGLMITAAAKLRNGKPMKLSYSGSISETIMFSREHTVLKANHESTDHLISLLNASHRRDVTSGNYVWEDVDGESVADYLDAFETLPSATKAQANVLAKYVRARLRDRPSELTDWTVALISNPGIPKKIGGLEIGCTERAKFPADEPLSDVYAIRRLVSPSDEMLDLSPEERDRALRTTRELWAQGKMKSKSTSPPDMPNGPSIRRARPASRGLLLIYALDPRKAELPAEQPPVIGLALSFPFSQGADEIEYMINNTYWEQEISLG